MKRFLSLFLFTTAMLTFAKTEVPTNISIDTKEIVEQITSAVSEVLDQPLVISTQSDTVISVRTDSAASKNNIIINITGKAPEVNSTVYPFEEEMAVRKLKEKREALTILLSIVIPCGIIALTVVGVFIFLFYKTKSRNRLIEKAIENNYELPDSFYSGINFSHTRVEGDASARKVTSDDNESQLPPLPNVPPVAPLNYMEKRQISNGIILTLVGIFIFLFFVCVKAVSVGFLAGGICVAIGASRIVTYWFLRK